MVVFVAVVTAIAAFGIVVVGIVVATAIVVVGIVAAGSSFQVIPLGFIST